MIRLVNPTRRKTEARIVQMADRDFFFSYQTCIAYAGPDGHGNVVRLRRSNSWGPTTGRHFNELGCADFKVVDDDTFERVLGEVS